MFFLGIDPSGPRNKTETALVAFNTSKKSGLYCYKSLIGADDYDILYFVNSLKIEGNLVVGIDAPLSYNIGGGDRPSDSDLRRNIISVGLKPGSVMPPTMNRMVYLTLRGISIARLLIATCEKIKIVEVHPGATMALRGAPIDDVTKYKIDDKSRWNLLEWMVQQGMKNITSVKNINDHFVAACASALAAWKWYQNKSVWMHPSEQPLHPFDFAC